MQSKRTCISYFHTSHIAKQMMKRNMSKRIISFLMFLCICLLLQASFLSSKAYANDLGVFGKTWGIAEEDLLLLAKTRLAYLQKSGYFDKLASHGLSEMKAKRTEDSHLPRTITPRSFFYDPAITLSQTIKAPNGAVIVEAHHRYSPLSSGSASDKGNKGSDAETFATLSGSFEPLLFYNASEPAQQIFASKMLHQYKGKITLIVTGGDSLKETHRLGQEIYRDENAFLTRKFGILQVPALVTKADDKLKISEVAP